MSGAPTTASSQDRARPRIGRYVITARLGRGGMGMVYRGYDEALERDVAVKTLIVEGALDDESRKRFEVEAKAAAKLQHPNIVTVFELGQDGKIPYIAMELLPGYDLEGLLRSGETLLLPEKLDIIVQVCRGLHYAHERHVIHRDVKPSNIRLLDDGSVKIMDFGIAKLANTSLTRTGMMVGTVHYMCPEQIQGQPIDGRSDVFSVGVILYELLAGRRPFESSQPGAATEILYKIVQEQTPTLPDLGPHTAALQDIVNRALAKKPAERYANASRLADDLAELRSRIGAVAPPRPEVIETIQAASRLVSQGRVDEGVTRLREMVERTPQSVEVRRALRAACREAARRTGQTKEADAEFPELTFQVGAMSETTVLAGTTPIQGSNVPSAADGRTLLIAGGVVLGFAVLAGLFLLLRPVPKDDTPPPAPPPVATAEPPKPNIATAGDTKPPTANPPSPRTRPPVEDRKEPGGAAAPTAAAPVKLTLATEPPGAEVTIDGRTVEGRTPVEIEVDPTAAHQVVFRLEGYGLRRATLPAGAPGDLSVPLTPEGPPGVVFVRAAYPFDVSSGARVLSKGLAAATVSLPPGRHALTITAPAVFLRMNTNLEVKSGETATLSLPELGQLNVQASPDSCEVFVDGESIGYLPIRKKPIASGRHVVLFKWPDGARSQETVEVLPGKPAFVTGEP